MEAEPALVWAESRVELDAESAVHLDFAFVVFPGDAELDDALGNGGNLEGGLIFWVLLKESGVLESGSELWGMSLVSSFAIKDSWEAEGCEPLKACSNSGSETFDDMIIVTRLTLLLVR
jgi:hypothetical protein